MEEKNVVTDNNLDTKFEHKDYKFSKFEHLHSDIVLNV